MPGLTGVVDAGDRGDAGAEAEANLRVQDMCPDWKRW